MRTVTPKKELNYLRILFFTFGLGIMSWIPRFPEVKEALKLTNGGFGSLISTGALGSLISLLTVGYVVHKIGVKRVLYVASFFLMATLIILTTVDSSLIFFFANIALVLQYLLFIFQSMLKASITKIAQENSLLLR